MNTTQVIDRHTADFLSTLLSMADNADEKVRPFQNKTINDFSPAFIEGADRFVNAFAAYLEAKGKGHLIDAGERSFGGNVFFSLSGHGCGFFDDKDGDVAGLQQVIQEWSGSAGRMRRFEELECSLDIGKDGKIDLCVLPGYVNQYRATLFAVPPGEEKKPVCTHTPGPWMDCGCGVLKTPNGQSVGTNVVEAKGWGRIFEVLDESNEPEGNFRLILAAPDLLSALEGVMKWWREVPLPDGAKADEMPKDVFDAALNAISKAKGL